MDDNEPLFTDHLTMGEQLRPVRQTSLGQAHFGGTGPEGKTCRECRKWYCVSQEGHRKDPEYKGDGGKVLYLQPAHCNHAIANKAYRLIPHDALSCMFFDEADGPPTKSRRDKRFGPRKKAAAI